MSNLEPSNSDIEFNKAVGLTMYYNTDLAMEPIDEGNTNSKSKTRSKIKPTDGHTKRSIKKPWLLGLLTLTIISFIVISSILIIAKPKQINNQKPKSSPTPQPTLQTTNQNPKLSAKSQRTLQPTSQPIPQPNPNPFNHRNGLINYKATCYQNSIIQALSDIHQFVSSIQSWHNYLTPTKKDLLPPFLQRKIKAFTELFIVFEKLNQKDEFTVVKTGDFIDAFGSISDTTKDFGNRFNHEDADEFLRVLLNEWKETTNQLNNYNNAFLKKEFIFGLDPTTPFDESIFDVESVYPKTCIHCNDVSISPSFGSTMIYQLPMNLESDEKSSIINLMKKEFHNSEMIPEKKCDNCNKIGAIGTEYLQHTSDYLLIQLNRVKNVQTDPENQQTIKLFNVVHIDDKLYLSKENIGFKDYSLQSIVFHSGDTAKRGHYFTVSKSAVTENGVQPWIKYDDSRVTVISEEQLQQMIDGTDQYNVNPYLMVYKVMPQINDWKDYLENSENYSSLENNGIANRLILALIKGYNYGENKEQQISAKPRKEITKNVNEEFSDDEKIEQFINTNYETIKLKIKPTCVAVWSKKDDGVESFNWKIFLPKSLETEQQSKLDLFNSQQCVKQILIINAPNYDTIVNNVNDDKYIINNAE